MAALTPEQREARRQRTEERKALERERREQEYRDKQLAAEAMRSILANSDSAPSEKIFALEVLENLNYYHFIPHESFTKTQIDEAAEARRLAFREEFARRHPEIMKEIESAKANT